MTQIKSILAKTNLLFCCIIAALLFAPAANAQDITSGLVGHWTLDQTTGTTLNDETGSNNGTWTGSPSITSAPGVVDNAIRLNGTNEYINIPDAAAYSGGTSDLTWSFWFNVDAVTTAQQMPLAKEFSSSVKDWGFYFNPDSTIMFYYENTAGDDTPCPCRFTQTFAPKQWHHISATYDNTTNELSLYRNGVFDTSFTLIHGLPNSSAPINIGRRNYTGSEHFGGLIDDVRIYNRILTEPDLQALYGTAACPKNGQGIASEGEFIYNEDYRVMQYCNADGWQSMGKGASLLHGQKTEGEDYDINAVEFDGSVNLTHSYPIGPSSSKRLTGSFWYKSNNASARNIINYRQTNGATLWNHTTEYYRIWGSNSGGTTVFDLRSTSVPASEVANWHHVIYSIDTSDTNKVHLYINDVDALNSTVTHDNDFIDFSTGDLKIGSTLGNAERLEGNIADYWLDVGTYIDLSVEANRRKFIDAQGRAINLGTDGSRPTGSAPEIFLSGDTANWHTNKGTGGGFTETSALTDSTTPPPAEQKKQLLGWWKLDETTGTTFKDNSANGFDTTATNITLPTASIIGPIGNGINFSENGQSRLETPSEEGLTKTNSYTFSAWINPTTVDGNMGIVRIGGVLDMRVRFNSNRIQVNPGRWDSNGTFSSTTSFPYNKWTHVAITYSYDDPVNTQPQIYYNGVAVPVQTNVGSSGPFQGMPASARAIIGYQGTSNGNFEGAIDDARIYNYVLSPTEIAELYAASRVMLSHVPNAVNFDASTTQRIRNGFTPPGADGTAITGSFWIRKTGFTGNNEYLMDSNGTNRIYIQTDGNLFFFFRDDAATTEHIRITADTQLTDNDWHHILYSFDVTNPSNRYVYVDDAPVALTVDSFVNGPIDFSPTNFTVLGSRNGTDMIDADISEFWFDYGTFIDLSVEANRRDFISAAGYPVDLGNDGSLPTGSAPDVYLGNPAATIGTNLGAGGGFGLVDGNITDVTGPAGVGYAPRYCSSPTQPEGTLIYNTAENVMQYCDGYQYIPLGPQGDGGGGCSNPSGSAGFLYYNTDFQTIQYCEGDEWIGVGTDNTPSLLKKGLLAHWRLDESGNTSIATDSSVNGNDATLINYTSDPSSKWASAVINNGLEFDGFNDFLDHNVTTDKNIGTIAHWVNVDASGGSYILYYESNNSSSIGNGFGTTSDVLEMHTAIDVNDNASLYMQSGAGASTKFRLDGTSNAITPGQWHHVAATWDFYNNTAKVFVDGIENASIDLSGIALEPKTTTVRRIGRAGSANRFLEGYLDDVRIYNRALSSAEIQSLYESANYDVCNDSPSLGQTCTDGSIYVGLHPVTSEPLYMMDSNASNSSDWGTKDNTGATSITDGESNQNWIATNRIISNYPSFDACYTSTAHGRDDWYLPSIVEMDTAYSNLVIAPPGDDPDNPIDYTSGINDRDGELQPPEYDGPYTALNNTLFDTSSERSQGNRIVFRIDSSFGGAALVNSDKLNNFRVRCMRKN